MSDTDRFVAQLAAAYRSIEQSNQTGLTNPIGADTGRDAAAPIDIAAVRAGAALRRRNRAVASITAVATVVGIGFAGWHLIGGDPSSGTPGNSPAATGSLPVISLGAGASELRASDRVMDWASTADVVVVATVISEKQGKVSPLDDGTDAAFVGRSVIVKVQTTAWSPDDVKVPAELAVEAPGWVQRGGKLDARLTYERGSRLEVGHTYVLALLKDRCGNPWDLLGSGAALPYDKGSIGNGEARGVTVTANAPKQTELTNQFASRNVDDVSNTLTKLLQGGNVTRQEPLC